MLGRAAFTSLTEGAADSNEEPLEFDPSKACSGQMTKVCIELKNRLRGPGAVANALVDSWNRTAVVGALISSFSFTLPLNPPNMDCVDCLPTETGLEDEARLVFEVCTTIGAMIGILGVLSAIALTHNLQMMMIDDGSKKWFSMNMPVTVPEVCVVVSCLLVLIGYLAGITFNMTAAAGRVVVSICTILIVVLLLFWGMVVRKTAKRVQIMIATAQSAIAQQGSAST